MNDKFYCPESGLDYTFAQIKELDPEQQISLMRNWFFDNFENPVEHTPYESREGGYIYIYGGPYDARQELEDMFLEVVPQEILNKLITELECESWEWSGCPSEEDEMECMFSLLPQGIDILEENLDNIKRLLGVNIPSGLESLRNNILYVNVITVLETFLSDTFCNAINKKSDLLKKFVRKNPDFAKEKFTLNKIYEQMDTIEKKVKKNLSSFSWHQLSKVTILYREILDIKFPTNMKPFYEAIKIRHDLVHRNGKTTDGEERTINNDDLNTLIDQIKTFCTDIATDLDSRLSDVQEC